jgi:hypothetical protein
MKHCATVFTVNLAEVILQKQTGESMEPQSTVFTLLIPCVAEALLWKQADWLRSVGRESLCYALPPVNVAYIWEIGRPLGVGTGEHKNNIKQSCVKKSEFM